MAMLPAGLKSNTVQLSNEAVVLKGRGFQPRRSGVSHGVVIQSHVPRGFIARDVDEGPDFRCMCRREGGKMLRHCAFYFQ